MTFLRVRKLLKMIKNDLSKPKLMILRKFCFFSKNFLKNFPILRWSGHFQRDEEWYQIVRWLKAFNLSYKRDLRVEELTSGGQFCEKISKNYDLKWRIFFQKFFSGFRFQLYLMLSTSHLLNSYLKKIFFRHYHPHS